MNKNVILVDIYDNEIGEMPKLEAHEKGLLHRAFSIFIFNSKGELLMQQRALDKYHSGGLWSNSCCSNPTAGEPILNGANERLKEEMGITCELKPITKFIYKAECNNGLIEHEYDHVFIGYTDEKPVINKSEVNDWKYMNYDELLMDIKSNPSHYSAWLLPCLINLKEYLKK